MDSIGSVGDESGYVFSVEVTEGAYLEVGLMYLVKSFGNNSQQSNDRNAIPPVTDGARYADAKRFPPNIGLSPITQYTLLLKYMRKLIDKVMIVVISK